jgi:hypothetical protein
MVYPKYLVKSVLWEFKCRDSRMLG